MQTRSKPEMQTRHDRFRYTTQKADVPVTLRQGRTLAWDTLWLFHEWYAICRWCNRAAYYPSCYTAARAAAPTVAGAPVHIFAQICKIMMKVIVTILILNSNYDNDISNTGATNSGRPTVHLLRFMILCRVPCCSHQTYKANKHSACTI